MQDKSGCLNCHFLAVNSITRDGIERESLESKYRNRDEFTKLIQRIDSHINLINCFRELWSAKTTGVENIENAVFREDRGVKCDLFSPYDPLATLESVLEKNRIKEEVIDRKVTRRLAWAAIIISAFATLLAAILPFLFT